MVVALFQHRPDTVIPPQIIISDNKCQLGQWIYSSESESFSNNDVFQKLKAIHKEFHLSAGAILTMAQQGKLNEAKSLEDDFYRQSEEVVQSLEKLKSI